MEQLLAKNVFLDTSVIISHNYFHSRSINELFNYAKNKVVKLYITAITYDEVKARIQHDINCFKMQINNSLSSNRILKNLEKSADVINTIDKLDFSLMEQELFKKFKMLIKNDVMDIIPLNQNISSQVFKMYFNQSPPFSSKKKSEFPDAFNVLTIEDWCVKNISRTYFISQDKDFSRFNSEYIIYENSLSKYLELVGLTGGQLYFSEGIRKAQIIYKRYENDILKQIKYLFDVELVKVVEGEKEWNSYEIKMLEGKLSKLHFISADDKTASAQGEIDITYSIDEFGRDWRIIKSQERRTTLPYEIEFNLNKIKLTNSYKIVQVDRLNNYNKLIIKL